MMVTALVLVAAATDITLSLHGDSASPGTVDGIRTDVSVGYGRRFGLTGYGGVRTNATTFDNRAETAWFQHSQAGLLAPDGTIPIGADVWSAGALLGARVGRGDVHGRLQVGWGLRGQSTAALGFVDGRYDYFDDGTEGRVHLRAANPVVGAELRVPVAKPLTASLTVRQYFPLNDPVVDLLPGITVVGVGLGFGKSAGEGGGGTPQPQTEILPTGVADVDALFAEVQGIRDELASLQTPFRRPSGPSTPSPPPLAPLQRQS